MSLDFELNKITDYKTLCWRQPEDGELEANDGTMFPRKVWRQEDGTVLIQNPITHALVWYSIPVGFSGITEKNYEEWYIRLQRWMLACGTTSNQITLEDVKAHIGLTTNAFPDKTKTQFNKFIAETTEDTVRRQMRTVAAIMEPQES